MSDTTVERALRLIQPILDDLGLTMWDCEWAGGTLRLTVDKPSSTPGHLGGVLLDDIALATRLINREFEHADPCPVPENYSMEVSSPGLERALREPKHFAAVAGAVIAVRLRDAHEGVRRIKGVLVSSDDGGFRVRDADSSVEYAIDYRQIDRVHTVFEWGPKPKPGGPKNKPGAKPAVGAGADAARAAVGTDEFEDERFDDDGLDDESFDPDDGEFDDDDDLEFVVDDDELDDESETVPSDSTGETDLEASNGASTQRERLHS